MQIPGYVWVTFLFYKIYTVIHTVILKLGGHIASKIRAIPLQKYGDGIEMSDPYPIW